MKNSVSLAFDPLLEHFENKLAFIITLTYQNSTAEVLLAVSEVVELTHELVAELPQLRDADWFEAIVSESLSFLSSVTNKQEIEQLHDAYFYNAKHLARYRREIKTIAKNNRIVIEDLFSTAVKISSIEKQFQTLIKLSADLSNSFKIKNERMANIFKRINDIAVDCECYSLLSIEVSWEIICCLISEIEDVASLTKAELNEMFFELEKNILDIESSICDILETVNVDLQVNFQLEKADLNYRRHFDKKSIFI